MTSPFPPTSSNPGHGTVHLSLLPPSTPTFSTLTYSYPLKLLPSTPHTISHPPPPPPPTNDPLPTPPTKSSTELPLAPTTVPLLFLLSYGGGLLASDTTHLTLSLAPSTRLVCTTQGSTKIYAPPSSPSPSPRPTTRQTLHATIGAHAALWLAPDPICPYAGSTGAQKQTFDIERGGSVGVVEWVSEGRRWRGDGGERWGMRGWTSGNDIYEVRSRNNMSERREGHQREEGKRLVVRDNIILEGDIRARMEGMGVFGTVLLYGPLFASLGGFFVAEFARLPRIGRRGDWASDWERRGPQEEEEEEEEAGRRRRDEWRRDRIRREQRDGVLWTASLIRGACVVKFAAREVEGARTWVRGMLREEGTVARECGEGGLMFVR